MWLLLKKEGTVVRECKGRESVVTSVCTTLDGKHFITGSDDKTARMWSLLKKEGTMVGVVKRWYNGACI